MYDRNGVTVTAQSIRADVAIIGAGTAGIVAERKARNAGARTVLIDPAFAGTTCATVGCMPSKLLIAAGKAAHAVRRSDIFGTYCDDLHVDPHAVMRRLRKQRNRFVDATKENLERLPDDICIKASARFVSATHLELDNGLDVVASAVVIATGASPRVPASFADLEELLLTNETVFDLESLRKISRVIGAGPLGLELAQALARLGVETALFDKDDRIAGIADEEINRDLRSILQEELPIYLGVDVTAKRSGNGVAVNVSGGDRYVFDRLLLATGRQPNVEQLNLAAAGLEIDNGGVPAFDEQTMQCSDAPVFIAGDANRDRPVLHEAAAEGAIAGSNAATYPSIKPSRRKLAMSIVFTDPNIAVIGEQPGNHGQRTVSGTVRFRNQGRALVEARQAGISKLHADATDGRLVGAILAGPDVEHLAHTVAWMIQGGAAAQDLLEMPFYHPTFEEGLKDALQEICAAVSAPIPRERDDGFLPGT